MARSLLAFLITALRTKRVGIACSRRALRSSAQVHRWASCLTLGPGSVNLPKLTQSVPAGSSSANGWSVAVHEMAESEVIAGWNVSAGTPGADSLPTMSWNEDCSAVCRWRGVSHRGGSCAVGGAARRHKHPESEG